MSSFTPEIFGKYLLLDQIAAGGMAELYRAKVVGSEGFEKLIAIKKILFHLHDDTELVDSFIAEAKLAAFLHHQNIVQVYDFGCVNDQYFLAMEFLSGKDLRFLIKKLKQLNKNIPIPIAIYIAAGICAGMDYAHKLKDYKGQPLNIIHRDIGPQNIFITYSGEIKIIDFGIAKASTHEANTQLGIIKGKVAYMSPEQARGDKIDARADIFSIGVVLYELLTGRKMYEGETFKIYKAACNAEYTPACEINDKLPPELYSILNKALHPDRDRRYQDAQEMLLDLDKCMQNNSMTLSPHIMSRYMNAVFSSEAKEDEKAIMDAALIDIPHANQKAESDVETVEEIIYNIEDVGLEKDRSKRRYTGYLIVLLFACFCLYVSTNISIYKDDSAVKKGINVFNTFFNKDTSAEIINKGKTFMEQLRYKDAVDHYQRYYEKDIKYKKELKPYYIEALWEYASSIFDREPNKASVILHRIINIDKSNTNALILLGKYYNQRKKYDKAIDIYRSALEYDNKNPEIFFNLGYIYAIKEDNLRAEEMFSSVVELKPSYIDEALVNLAIIQSKRGNTSAAMLNINKALKINPANKQARRIKRTFKIK